jgi:Ca2+-binding RTX toxin-like protein
VRNVVSVTGGHQEVRIGDRAALIEVGPGCSRIDRHSVRCSEPELGVERVFIATAGGADTVRSEYSARFFGEVIVNGGRGDDLLVGGAHVDRLYAGEGDDVLRGRGGDDHLYDASPLRPLRRGDPSPFGFDDVRGSALANPGPGRDSFNGGTGSDDVSYEARSASVRVDLANSAPIGGARGERDSVSNVEGAVGGAGDDRLAGNRRVNTLDGAEGDDRIAGRRGGDFIEGGRGRNVIIAGSGDDQINAPYRPSDEGAERVFCGVGQDSLAWVFPNDFVNDDCESLSFNFLGHQGLFGGSVSVLPLEKGDAPIVLTASELWCYFVANPSGCQLRLELLVDGPGGRGGTAPPRGTLLGSQDYTFAANERKGVVLSLSPTGVQMLRRHGLLRVLVRVTEGGAEPSAGYLTVLRTP